MIPLAFKAAADMPSLMDMYGQQMPQGLGQLNGMQGIFPFWNQLTPEEQEQLLNGMVKQDKMMQQQGMQMADQMGMSALKDMQGYAQAAPLESLMSMSMAGLGKQQKAPAPTFQGFNGIQGLMGV